MENSQQTGKTCAPATDLLAHLEEAFGWSEGQALDALGTCLMETEAGRALGQELAARNRQRRAA